MIPCAERDRVAEYGSQALRGDLSRARLLFESRSGEDLTAAERELEQRFTRRFVARDEAEPELAASAFVRAVVGSYHDYWRRALMGELDHSAGTSFLREELQKALVAHRPEEPVPAAEEVLAEVERRVEAEGLHFQGGVTLPHHDLMVWTSEETQGFECELTDARQKVEVVFMAGFLEFGWSHYATFGSSSTGGWATRERLYCLRESYDLASEHFLVSYLKHEARHFADYALYPALEQIDLEYRAKLTELAFARSSLFSLLVNFSASAALDRAAPHSFANHCVLRDLSRELLGEEVLDGADPRWRESGVELVQGAARLVLEQHSERLDAAGAATTTGVLSPSDATR